MVSNQKHHSRIDILELKSLIFQKIGHQRTERYFDHLKRFFSFKVSKIEFDKSCGRIIGRENIYLHNHLIQSIFNNACLSKLPPRKPRQSSCSQRNSLQSLYSFPPSPRKCRTPVNRDRKFRDRSSPLEVVETPSELLHCIGSRPPIEVPSIEDGEEVEQIAGSTGIQSRSPVTAPLGISVKIVRSLGNNHSLGNCQNNGELPDSRFLRNHMKRIIEGKGIVGTSMDCANVLNNGLDVYLKRIIKPCIGLARLSCKQEHIKPIHRRISYNQNGCLVTRYTKMLPEPVYATMLDLRVSMEGNRRKLGDDWSIQLEKISSQVTMEEKVRKEDNVFIS